MFIMLREVKNANNEFIHYNFFKYTTKSDTRVKILKRNQLWSDLNTFKENQIFEIENNNRPDYFRLLEIILFFIVKIGIFLSSQVF